MSQSLLDTEFLQERLAPMAVEEADYGLMGYHLRLTLKVEKCRDAAAFLKEAGYFLEFITAVDWGDRMDLLYFFGRWEGAHRIQAVARISSDQPAPSLTGVFSSANWQEREVYDLFGVKFTGHPGLKRILLPENADFYPLSRDFEARPEHAGDVVNLDVDL